MADRWQDLGFRPDNHAVIQALMAKWANKGACAVFDWDNTSIAGDIGELMFFYQLDNGCMRLSPQAFAQLLVQLVKRAKPCRQLSALVTLADVSWKHLWAQAQTGQLAHMAQGPHHQAWRLALVGLYQQLTAANMPKALVADSYFLLAQLWAGFNHREVFDHTLHGLRWAKQLGPQMQHWKLLPTNNALELEHSFAVYAEPREPMRALYRRFDEVGILPWVISASFEPIVRACAHHFGYQVDNSHIFGLRLAEDSSGYFLPQACSQHPITYRDGKVLALHKYITGRPIFVAGDAITDYELLMMPKGLEVRLVVDRKSTARLMKQLYQKGQQMRPDLAALAQGLGQQSAIEPITLVEDEDALNGRLAPGVTQAP